MTVPEFRETSRRVYGGLDLIELLRLGMLPERLRALGEEIEEYFAREVKPHVPDAWIDEGYRDHKDGDVGRVGYEISFNRYFYQYTPPRPLDEIEGDLKRIEEEIADMLAEVTE